jgi:hypothetical protein
MKIPDRQFTEKQLLRVPLAACVTNAWLIYATAAAADWLGLGIVVIAALLLFALRAARLRSN